MMNCDPYLKRYMFIMMLVEMFLYNNYVGISFCQIAPGFEARKCNSGDGGLGREEARRDRRELPGRGSIDVLTPEEVKAWREKISKMLEI